jgi:hypothetical protein
MHTFSKFVLCGLLAVASTSVLAQTTSPTPSNPQPAPAAPMPGMMMQQGSGQPGSGAQAPAQQQGGMMQGGMQCGMMQRSAQTADAVKQLQQQVAEMRTMLEQMSKR